MEAVTKRIGLKLLRRAYSVELFTKGISLTTERVQELQQQLQMGELVKSCSKYH